MADDLKALAQAAAYGTPIPSEQSKRKGRPPKDPNAPPKEKKVKDPNATGGRGRPKGSKTNPSKLKDVSLLTNPKRRLEGNEYGAEHRKKRKAIEEDRNKLQDVTVHAGSEVNGYHAATEEAMAGASRDFAEESTQRIADYDTAYSKFSETGTDFTRPGSTSRDATPFVSVTCSFKVTVPPIAALYPLEGALAHYISPLLLTWHEQLDGVVLAYNHAKLHTHPPSSPSKILTEEQPMAQAIDECAAPYIWLTLSLLIFRPAKGLEMEGYLSLQTESHITLILWNFFTVTVPHKRLPHSWQWHDSYTEDENFANWYTSNEEEYNERQWGAWCDRDGKPVEGFCKFRIRDWDCAPPGTNGEGSFLSIEGSMLTDEEEKELKRKQEQEARVRREAMERARVGTPLRSALSKRGESNAPSSAAGTPAAESASGKKKGRPKKNAA